MKRHFDNWIDGFLKYTENAESPKIYKQWVALSLIASVLKRKCFLEWDGKKFPNMYIILVGPSGKARKGTVMSPALVLLRTIGIDLAAEAITREALIKELAQAAHEDTFISDEGTPRITVHSSLTIYSKELTVFLGYNNQQLLSDLTDWYDCDPVWTYRTKNMGTDKIDGVYVNLIGATTPELIQKALPLDAVGLGLSSRIIFIFASGKEKSIPFPFLNRPTEELTDKLIMDLENIHGLRGEFGLTKAAMELYEPWYIKDQYKTHLVKDSRFNGYVERRANHVLKMCMLLSAAKRTDQVIDEVILKDAIAMLVEAEKNMPRALRGIGRNEFAGLTEDVLDYVKDLDSVSYPNLHKEFRLSLDKTDMAKVLGMLSAMKEIKVENTKAGNVVTYIGSQ